MSSVTSGGNGERVTISPDGKGFVGLTQGQDISREGGRGMCRCGSTRVYRWDSSDR